MLKKTTLHYFWHYFEEWLRSKFNSIMTFNEQTLLFGKFKNRNMNRIQNLLILTIKQFIFAHKYENVPKNSTLMLKQPVTDTINIKILLLLKNRKFVENEKHKQTFCYYKMCYNSCMEIVSRLWQMRL